MVRDPARKETPSQTAGPFVHIGLAPGAAGLERAPAALGGTIAGPQTPGRRIRIAGRVLDGDGMPLRDAMLETWQADADGIFASPMDPRTGQCAPDFTGWGRFAADLETGDFVIDTVKPGPVPGPNDTTMAPHLALWIVARGINLGLSTRIYFADEEAANAADPILRRIENAERRRTLLAVPEVGDDGRYRFDVRLQGEAETVFFQT
jgi:protocatechuate 3,4-dioxygenase alpha subunit